VFASKIFMGPLASAGDYMMRYRPAAREQIMSVTLPVSWHCPGAEHILADRVYENGLFWVRAHNPIVLL
jgi:hypothetical protein